MTHVAVSGTRNRMPPAASSVATRDWRASSGTSLPVPLRRDMESVFRHDFASVRVHTDRLAGTEATALGARAFTLGSDISFAPNRYSPSSREGRRLLAHELTHVVQQGGTTPPARAPVHPALVGAVCSPGEREAATVAARVAAGASAGPVRAATQPVVQRQPDTGSPGPDDQPAPTPTRAPAPAQRSWSPSARGVFSILVESSNGKPEGCSGSAATGVGLFPLSRCARIEHFCTTPARYPLQIRFYVDSVATPRPAPFRPPALSVAIDFTPSGGAPRRVANGADASPRYVGAGWPLVPAFGEMFSAASSQSGLLSVQARLNDPDSGTTVAYRDTVSCELVPCA